MWTASNDISVNSRGSPKSSGQHTLARQDDSNFNPFTILPILPTEIVKQLHIKCQGPDGCWTCWKLRAKISDTIREETWWLGKLDFLLTMSPCGQLARLNRTRIMVFLSRWCWCSLEATFRRLPNKFAEVTWSAHHWQWPLFQFRCQA